MTFTVDLSYEDVEPLIQQALVEMLKSIEDDGGEDLVDTWDAINEVLAFVSPPNLITELAHRDIPARWFEIVLQHDLNKT